ncbi:PAS domain-containing protein [Streptomyces phyllanthi]|uniref:PAS domain-containing protein n=1 Tax=Streptomyces phyllanthi TaxID=1803180 RepID=UPI002AD399B1|nr:PAS domain-containing protein [Streptomyces phyllanthi]
MARRRATDQVPGSPGCDFDEALSAQVTIDGHGIVTGWNAGAEKLFGYPLTQMVGRPAAGLLAEEIDESELRSLAQLPRWTGRIALRHRDGHRLEARVMAHRRAPDSGRLEWFLVLRADGAGALARRRRSREPAPRACRGYLHGRVRHRAARAPVQ